MLAGRGPGAVFLQHHGTGDQTAHGVGHDAYWLVFSVNLAEEFVQASVQALAGIFDRQPPVIGKQDYMMRLGKEIDHGGIGIAINAVDFHVGGINAQLAELAA